MGLISVCEYCLDPKCSGKAYRLIDYPSYPVICESKTQVNDGVRQIKCVRGHGDWWWADLEEVKEKEPEEKGVYLPKKIALRDDSTLGKVIVDEANEDYQMSYLVINPGNFTDYPYEEIVAFMKKMVEVWNARDDI